MKLWSTALCTPPSFTPRHRPIYRCSASRAQRVPTKKDPGASSSRRGGGGGGGGGLVPAPEIKFEIDLSIAVKIGREIRWPMVIERGGETGTGENTLRDDVALRGGERERGRRRIGGGTGDRRSGGGSASSAISYPSMVHGMPVHGAVMHIMGGMCTCRRSQLFDTAAARYTCRRYLSHASRMGLRLTPSFPTRFRLPPCPPFVRLLLIDNLAGSRTK